MPLFQPGWYKAAENVLESNATFFYVIAIVIITVTIWMVWIQPSKVAAAVWLTYMLMP